MPAVGDKAPSFSLPGENGDISLAAFPGKAVVLYFYPKDDTSGCTNEAKAFTALADDFAAARTVVVGVSRDSLASHKKFRTKYDLKVELGADVEGEVTEAFGVWVQKKLYGREYMGIERATFLIDQAGTIRQVWRKVKVPGHAEAVLAAAKAL
jgi:thioredoxin-dependent peroxiredoxin